MKKVLKILIPVLILIAIIASVVINRITSKIIFNDTYVNGNTQGNLYNQGTFCEHNGIVYFANPDDKNKLYSMDINGGNIKKLCDDTVFFINADDHYLYYARNNSVTDSDYFFFSLGNNSLCRLPLKGGKATILDDAPCMYVSLCGNYLYYLHYDKSKATTLYRIKIDGTEKEMVSKTPSLTCGALGKNIYFCGEGDDGFLYCLNTETKQISTLINYNCYNPIVVSESNIYFLDVANNNRLIHTSTVADSASVLTNRSIDFYNVYGSYIYYQTYDENGSGLYRIKNDGSGETMIASGIYKEINITSKYIYFKDSTTNTTYYTSTSNPGIIEVFRPGK